jgi:Protein of unknown function (DUF3891)
MLVQTAVDGGPHFVITMREHCAFAGAMARAFGNADFEPLAPREEMLDLVTHHDEGWWHPLDEAPGRDPATGLPWHLTHTPREVTVRILSASPDALEKHHPYCGLLSAMHMYGIYRGRFGLSDQHVVETIQPPWRARFETELHMLEQRQAELTARLAADPVTAAWVEPAHLMQNYKQLQFFDMLALYFNATPPGHRAPTEIARVPRSATQDVTIRITPLTDEVYAFEPYPFGTEEVVVTMTGRAMRPACDVAALTAAMRITPTSTQTVRFVAA